MALLLAGSVAGLGASSDGAEEPMRHLQWPLDLMHVPEAWGTTTGEGATVAVVDTGVDLGHADLVGTRTAAGATIVGGCVPVCGDGSFGSHPADVDDLAQSHGTRMAGVIFAQHGNGVGMAGVAPGATLMSVRVINPDNSSIEDVAAGIRHAADAGADVINVSLGATPTYETLNGQVVVLHESLGLAVTHAADRGAVVVAAAGNEPFYPTCYAPAGLADALCVTGVDRRAMPAISNSALAKPHTHDQLIVSAPGTGAGIAGVSQGGQFCSEPVWSLYPEALFDNSSVSDLPDRCGLEHGPGNRYLTADGTSASAAFVSGVAALVRSIGCDRDQTLDILTSTARNPVTGLRGVFHPRYGYGIVDAAAATAAADSTCR